MVIEALTLRYTPLMISAAFPLHPLHSSSHNQFHSPKQTIKISLQITTTSTPTNPLNSSQKTSIKCIQNPNQQTLKTCKNCKTQFDPSLNHPRACRFHTSHFGGETKRKFESVYTGGTMSTPDAGRVFQYWHCCGSEDPFDCGCTAAPHSSYDDN